MTTATIANKPKAKGNPNWKPGKSANPSGRPKGPSLTKALFDEFRQARDGESDRTIESVIRAIIDAALGGDMKAAAMIWERTDGKVRDELIVTDGPQEIRVIRDRPDAAA